MYNVEWELVRQKNRILELVNEERYEEALLLLDFSESLWKECSYAYKTREIRERIKRELGEHFNPGKGGESQPALLSLNRSCTNPVVPIIRPWR